MKEIQDQSLLQIAMDAQVHVGRPLRSLPMRPFVLGSTNVLSIDSGGIPFEDGMALKAKVASERLNAPLDDDRDEDEESRVNVSKVSSLTAKALKTPSFPRHGGVDRSRRTTLSSVVEIDQDEFITEGMPQGSTSWVGGKGGPLHSLPYWIIDPRLTLHAWKKLLLIIDETMMKDEPILVVCTDERFSGLAKAMMAPFIIHQTKEKQRHAPVTLLTHRWIYGRLSNYDLIRKMTLKYQVTPVHERKYADHLRYTRFRRPLESLRVSGKMPGLVIFLNTSDHLVAIQEAFNVGVASAGVVNTNFASPDSLTHFIPGNDQDASSYVFYLSLRIKQFHTTMERKNKVIRIIKK